MTRSESVSSEEQMIQVNDSFRQVLWTWSTDSMNISDLKLNLGLFPHIGQSIWLQKTRNIAHMSYKLLLLYFCISVSRVFQDSVYVHYNCMGNISYFLLHWKKKSYSLERHEGNYIEIHFSSFFLMTPAKLSTHTCWSFVHH